MGIYSTSTVSKSAALRVIKEKLDYCSNDELSEILFVLFQNKAPFHNFYVKNSYQEKDDEELENRINNEQ